MTIDPTKVKCVAFDLFGTVFDISNTDKQEIRDYIAHVRKPEWSPLVLPLSWRNLKPFPDVAEGLAKLIELNLYTVTCSNAPWEFTDDLLHRSGLWYLIHATNTATLKQFKPHPYAYRTVCDQFDYGPEEVLMVTGNAKSPDIKGAQDIGMQAIQIRQPGTPATIIELANLLVKP